MGNGGERVGTTGVYVGDGGGSMRVAGEGAAAVGGG